MLINAQICALVIVQIEFQNSNIQDLQFSSDKNKLKNIWQFHIIVLSLHSKSINKTMKTSEMIVWVAEQRAKGLTDEEIEMIIDKK